MPELVKQVRAGIQAWAATTLYNTLGIRRSRGGQAYELIQTGTSGTTGPSGTGSSIQDGTARWKWSSAVDYTSVQAWYDALPSTATQAYAAEVWDDEPIQGVSFLAATRTIAGLSATNYLAVRPAPGEGFADKMGGGANLPLAFPTKGVRFIASNGTNAAWYLHCKTDWLTVEGIAFKDQSANSQSIVVYLEQAANRFTLRRCIIDGYAGPGYWLYVSDPGTKSWLVDNLFIDRRSSSLPAGSFVWPIDCYGPADIVGNTLVNVAGGSPEEGIINNNAGAVGAVLARNNLIVGYSKAFVEGGSAVPNGIVADHNVTTSASIGDFINDAGGNVTGASASALFVSATTDFRLKAGSAALGAGAVDTTHDPLSLDILETPRGATWDAGAAEGMVWAAGLATLGATKATGAAAQSLTASAAVPVGTVAATATATVQAYQMTGKATVGPVVALSAMSVHHITQAAISISGPSAVATLLNINGLDGLSTLLPVTSKAFAGQEQPAGDPPEVNPFTADFSADFGVGFTPAVRVTVGEVTATGTMTQTPGAAIGKAAIGAVTAKATMSYPRPIAGTTTVGTVKATATLQQRDMMAATVSLGPVKGSSIAAQATRAALGIITIGPVKLAGAGFTTEPIVGLATLPSPVFSIKLGAQSIGSIAPRTVGPVAADVGMTQAIHMRAVARISAVKSTTQASADNGMRAAVSVGTVSSASRFARRVKPPSKLATLILPWE